MALVKFPLEADSWRRAVAVLYLELRTDSNLHSQEIQDYLASPASGLLKEEERANILEIMKRAEAKAAKAMAR